MERAWTLNEVIYLINHYPYERTSKLAKKLGRSVRDLHAQASLRGLEKSRKLIQEYDLDLTLRAIKRKRKLLKRREIS